MCRVPDLTSSEAGGSVKQNITGLTSKLICRTNKHRQHRRGFTITELLVSIAIVGVLLGLILPAVARSRESARRVQCVNNLRQVGVAMHNFAGVHGGFPVADYATQLHSAADPTGFHQRLLPFLEAQEKLSAARNNQGTPVPVYLCPNDPETAAAAVSGIVSNYFVSNGVGFMFEAPFTGFRINNGGDVFPRDITDGLSNTVAISEHLWFTIDLTQPVDERNPRVFWWTDQRYYDSKDIALAIDQAMNHRVSPNPQAIHTSYMTYDHMLPPNHPASYNGPDATGADGDHQLNPSTSLHGDLVNSLLADGSCRVTTNSVDLSVWHALGTRASRD